MPIVVFRMKENVHKNVLKSPSLEQVFVGDQLAGCQKLP